MWMWTNRGPSSSGSATPASVAVRSGDSATPAPATPRELLRIANTQLAMESQAAYDAGRHQPTIDPDGGEYARTCITIDHHEFTALWYRMRDHRRLVFRWHCDGTPAVENPPRWVQLWLTEHRKDNDAQA